MNIAHQHAAASNFLRSLLGAGARVDGFTELSERLAVASDWRSCLANSLERASSLKIRVRASRDCAAAIEAELARFGFEDRRKERVLQLIVGH